MKYGILSMDVGTYYRRHNLSPHLTLYYQVIEKLKDRQVRVVNLHSGQKYTLSENDLHFYSMQVMHESEMATILLGELP